MIYFLHQEGSNFVKIGWTERDSTTFRASELQVGNAMPFHLLMTLPGGGDREDELHAQFAAFHVKGDWYRMEGPLLKFITTAIGTIPGMANSEVRYVAVRVMTLSSKQVTQTFFRQIVEEEFIDWSLVHSAYAGEEIPQQIDVDAFANGTPWGRVRFDCKRPDDFQLVWQKDQELRRCLLTSHLTEEWFLDKFGDHYINLEIRLKKDRAFKKYFDFCLALNGKAFDMLSKLDHLFIGV